MSLRPPLVVLTLLVLAACRGDPSDPCRDEDGDGHGDGKGCADIDCDDSDAACWAGDCCETCDDPDGDGYGDGAGCQGADCDETAPACAAGDCCAVACYDLPTSGACGPETACVVVTDDEVDGPAFRNGAPAVLLDGACRPRVLYGRAEGGFDGFEAIRSEGIWQVEDFPSDLALVDADLVRSEASALAFVSDGSNGTAFWSLDTAATDAGWTREFTASGSYPFGAVGAPATGVSSVLLGTSDFVLSLATWVSDAWSVSPLGLEGPNATVASSPDGVTEIAYWESEGSTWTLTWAVPGRANEPVLTDASAYLDGIGTELAVLDGGDDLGQPVILTLRGTESGSLTPREVVLARRDAADTWLTVSFAQDVYDSLCYGPPTDIGQTCDYDYVEHHIVGLARVGPSEVRFLYTATHFLGSLASAECAPTCYWTVTRDETTTALILGWLEGDEGATASIGESGATSGRVFADGSGMLHLALYEPATPAPGDRWGEDSSTRLRVLEIGAP